MKPNILLILLILSGSLFALDSENIECISWTWTSWDEGEDLALQGDYAYIAGGYSGLIVVNTSDPESLFVASIWDNARIYANCLCISDTIALVGAGEDGLFIIDVSDPTSPVEISHIATDDSVADVAVQDGYAYVADMEGGLKVIDVSDPEHPRLVRTFLDELTISGVYLQGRYAYLVSLYPEYGFSLVLIVNIYNPEYPFEVGAFYDEHYVCDICFNGDYAYVTNGREKFSIIDISDKRNPRHRAWGGECRWWLVCTDMTRSGDYLYIADGYSEDAWQRDPGPECGLQIYDISDPSSPEYLSSRSAYSGDNGGRIAVKDDIALILQPGCDGGPRLISYDVSDPEEPERSSATTDGYYNRIEYLFISGSKALIWSEYMESYELYDVSNPEDSRLIYRNDTLGIRDFFVSGDYAYAASYCHDLLILDISNPSEPQVLSITETIGGANAVFVQDSIAFICETYQNEGFLRIFNVIEPENPDSLSSCFVDEDDRRKHEIFVSGECGFVISKNSRRDILIINLSDILNPRIINSWDVGNNTIYDIHVQDNYAYIVGEEGLIILNVTDREDIEQTAFLEIEHATGVFVEGIYAYITVGQEYYNPAENKGVYVIDISDPANPVQMGYMQTPGYAHDVFFANGLIYVADYNNLGIYRFLHPATVDNNFTQHPTSFILHPAYPNPFNSSTTITYTLPTLSNVSLSIYNTRGQLVDVLLDRVMPAGRHSLVWDGNEMSAGVYLARMKVDSGRMRGMQKIVLVK